MTTRRSNRMRKGTAPRIAAIAALSGLLLTSCGGSDDTPVLTWYINPDDGGQQQLAQQCTEEADGAYTIRTSLLPRDAPDQREQLARRLAAGDSSMDIMSIDPPFIPELAEPGFLAPVPDDVAERTTEDTLEGVLDGATWQDELVTVPFWANTQILWYRESVAEAAGLDMSEPVTWDELIEATREQEKYLSIQGVRGESMTVWVNALMESQGESILVDPAASAEELKTTLDSEAGRRAAEIISTIGQDGLAGPGVASLDENQGMLMFQRENGAFMVNWPFVWTATNASAEEGTIDADVPDDMGWAPYPRVDADTPAATPLGGINLGVGIDSQHHELAYDAIECIVAPENQSEYFVTNGNPPSSESAYDDERIEEEYPMAEVIRDALDESVPRPQTPYYSEISETIQDEFTPISSVNPDVTPQQTDKFIGEVLRGEKLL